MRKLSVLLLLLSLSLPVMAQDKYTEIMIVDEPQSAPAAEDEDYVFHTAEVMPEFPGGMQGLMEWLCDHVTYPADAKENKIQGKVVVTFVVDKSGVVRNPRVVRSKHPLLDAEALRVVNEMPRFTPGTMKGHPVNVWYTLPVNFKLDNR